MAILENADYKNIAVKPIYLLVEPDDPDSPGKSIKQKFKKCSCAECQNVFKLYDSITLVANASHSPQFPDVYAWFNNTYDVDSKLSSNDDMSKLRNLECPDCGAKGAYSIIKMSPDGNGWNLPYSIESRTLEQDGSVITDTVRYSAVQIGTNDTVTKGSVTAVETIDLEKRTRSASYNHENDGRYSLHSFEGKGMENDDMFVHQLPAEKANDSEKTKYRHKYGSLKNSDARQSMGKNMRLRRTNPIISLDVNNPIIMKEWRTNSRFRSSVYYFNDSDPEIVGHYDTMSCVGNLPDRTDFIKNGNLNYDKPIVYKAQLHIQPDEITKKLESAKRQAILSSFDGKVSFYNQRIKDVCLDASKSNLFARSHKKGQTEATVGANEKYSALYTDMMVKYPAVFEMACVLTNGDIKRRAIEHAMKDPDIESKKDTDEYAKLINDSVTNYMNDKDALPDTAIARHFRENMFNLASQLYSCDPNIKKECAKAKDYRDLFNTLKFYAFGPEITNTEKLGSTVIIPDRIKKNGNIEPQTVLQNDDICVNEFIKHPIGFANIKYTLVKEYGKSLDENAQLEVIHGVIDKVKKKSGVNHKPDIEEDSMAYYKTSKMIHDFTISPLTPEEKRNVKNIIDRLSLTDITNIYTDNVSPDKHIPIHEDTIRQRNFGTNTNRSSRVKSTMRCIFEMNAIKECIEDEFDCKFVFDKKSDASAVDENGIEPVSDESIAVLDDIILKDYIKRHGITDAYVQFADTYYHETEDVVNTAARELYKSSSMKLLNRSFKEIGVDETLEKHKALIDKLNMTDPIMEISSYEPDIKEIHCPDSKESIRQKVSFLKHYAPTKMLIEESELYTYDKIKNIEFSEEELEKYNDEITIDNETYSVSPVTDPMLACETMINAHIAKETETKTDDIRQAILDKKIVMLDVMSEYFDEPIANIIAVNEDLENIIVSHDFMRGYRSLSKCTYVSAELCITDFAHDLAEKWAENKNVDTQNIHMIGEPSNAMETDRYIVRPVRSSKTAEVGKVATNMKIAKRVDVIKSVYGEKEDGSIDLPEIPDDLKDVFGSHSTNPDDFYSRI